MTRIDSADQATDIAISFLKDHYRISQRPLSAKRDQGKWIVEVDVGAFYTVVARVTIDSDTGVILDYQVEQPAK